MTTNIDDMLSLTEDEKRRLLSAYRDTVLQPGHAVLIEADRIARDRGVAETETEWAVRWFVDPQPTYEVEPVDSEEAAKRLVELYSAWNGEVVSRTVTIGEWAGSEAQR